MLTLISLPPAFGLPSGSGFAIKAMHLLTLSGQTWQNEPNPDPRKFPKGKLPALRTPDAGLIGDSENIRAYLETHGADFDAGLSPDDKANARAFIRMAEEHLYFQVLYERWCDPRVWPHVREMYFGSIPGVLRGFVTERIRKPLERGLHVQGIARFSEDERLARINPDLDAITTRLAQRPYLFGDAPTAADASVAPMVHSLAVSPVETKISARVAGDPTLSAYCERMAARLR